MAPSLRAYRYVQWGESATPVVGRVGRTMDTLERANTHTYTMVVENLGVTAAVSGNGWYHDKYSTTDVSLTAKAEAIISTYEKTETKSADPNRRPSLHVPASVLHG